jgi:hypothetical protein
MKVAFDGRAAAQAYTRAFRRMWELPGFHPQEALRAEAGIILKAWAGRTKVADNEASVLRRARLDSSKSLGMTRFEGQSPAITITAGVRGQVGRIWLKTRKNKPQAVGYAYAEAGSVHWEHRRFSNTDWSAIVASVNAYRKEYPQRKKEGQRSVGLSRQSVIQIADDLGIDLTKVQGQGVSSAGIAKARAAIASNGRAYRNGTGYTGGDKNMSFVQLINRLPYGHKAGMDRTLAGVLMGRAKFIEQSYAKGAFNSINSAARAFPNLIKVSLPLAG